MERIPPLQQIVPSSRPRSTKGSAVQARGREGERAPRPSGGGRRSRSASQPLEGNGGAGDEELPGEEQQLQTYVDFLRSDVVRNVVQLETSSEFYGQASYALCEAAYSASGACSGLMVSP